MKYVIIGNGIAGVHAAETIRRLDPGGSLTIIADETTPPYCRPMISMVLEGTASLQQLPIRSPRFYEENDIQPVLGQRVTCINPQLKIVNIQDQSYPYDKLLIATGADPRPIKAEGLALQNLHYLRTDKQVAGILDSLKGAQQALVLGGGLVGFKAAYGLLRRGLKVLMLIRSGYPLSLQVDQTAGQMILQELVKNGLEVRVEVEAAAFEGNDRVQRAHLSDESEVPCDVVVIGKGVLPALDFVPRDQIEVDLGILVNQHMQTSAKDIYAAGDVAEFIDIARQRRWVNAIWPEAVAQGRIAGFNMAGRPVTYKGSLSRNVIRIFDLDILVGGVVNPDAHDEAVAIDYVDHRRRLYRKVVLRNNRLIGVVLVNAIEQGGPLISLIQNQTPILKPAENLLQPGFNVRQLLP